jgi:hypothetical protein
VPDEPIQPIRLHAAIGGDNAETSPQREFGRGLEGGTGQHDDDDQDLRSNGVGRRENYQWKHGAADAERPVERIGRDVSRRSPHQRKKENQTLADRQEYAVRIVMRKMSEMMLT